MTITPMLIWLLAAPPSGCVRAKLDPLPAKVARLAPAERIKVVSKTLAVACDHRLPPEVIDALDAFHATDTAEHGPVMLQALRDAPQFAKAGCEAWEAEFSSHQAPGDKLRSIFRACAFGKAGLATEEELVLVADLGAVYLAMPLYRWLVAHRTTPATARKLVRGLMGLRPHSRIPPERGRKKQRRP